MKISELDRKCKELKLELGDTVNLNNENGSSQQVVFCKTLFRDGGRPRLQFSGFKYYQLNGVAIDYSGSGDDGNFDFSIGLVDILRWTPSGVDVKKVRLIREDLKSSTFKYIR